MSGQQSSRHCSGIRILVVGRDDLFLGAVFSALPSHEAEVISCDSCSAVSMVMEAGRRNQPFNVVILDIDRPKEDVAFPRSSDTLTALQRESSPGITRYLLCSVDGSVPKEFAGRVNYCFRKSMISSALVSFIERLMMWQSADAGSGFVWSGVHGTTTADYRRTVTP